jgi:hypothetical protein
MDNHLAAVITVIGMTCDVLGGLYLAYDLLGGENGPLARLTKIVNYSVLMILLFLFPMGLKFSLIVGAAFGTALGLHFDRIGKNIPDTNKFLLGVAALRAIATGIAVTLNATPVLAIVIAVAVFAMSYLLPKFRISPVAVYQSAKKPQLNFKQLIIAGVLAGTAIAVGVFGASITGGDKSTIHFAVTFGITFGMAVMVVTTVSPLVEWYSDHLPPKSFGTAGIILFIRGFIIQAIPSIATIFDAAP